MFQSNYRTTMCDLSNAGAGNACAFLTLFAPSDIWRVAELFKNNVRLHTATPREIVAWVMRDIDSFLHDGGSGELRCTLLTLRDAIQASPEAATRYARYVKLRTARAQGQARP